MLGLLRVQRHKLSEHDGSDKGIKRLKPNYYSISLDMDRRQQDMREFKKQLQKRVLITFVLTRDVCRKET